MSLLSYLFVIQWSLTLVLLLLVFFYIRHVVKFVKEIRQLRTRQTEEIRKTDYIGGLLMSREASKEIRLFSLSNYLRSIWEGLVKKADQELIVQERQQVFRRSLWITITAATISGAQAVLIWQLGDNKLTLGLVVALFTGIGHLLSASDTLATAYLQSAHLLINIEYLFSFF
ncbi:hypothetical protein D3C73_818720 [compost metagenome]